MPEAYGLYYSWGNLDGHPAGAGYDFSQATYDETPAASISENLSLNEDAARATLGEPWRMPTAEEFQELSDNCSHIWTTLNGVNGILFTSNVNGRTIFFPAAGSYNGTTLFVRGSNGYYWSSTFRSSDEALLLYFGISQLNPQRHNSRFYGYSVRAVKDGTPNRSIIPPTPEDEPKEEETPTVEEPKDKDER